MAKYGIETRPNSTFHGYLITVDVEFANLVKMVSARLLHCEVTMSLFVTNKYFGIEKIFLSIYSN